MKKINKQKIALKKKEILEKAQKLKTKWIKYNEMEEILNVKERILWRSEKAYSKLWLRCLESQSTKPNRLVEKRILTDSMLRIIEQTRKENLFYCKEKLKEILLKIGYDLNNYNRKRTKYINETRKNTTCICFKLYERKKKN